MTSTVNQEKIEKVVKNKWFILSKYVIAGLLVLSSILALVGAWYVNRTIDGSTIAWITNHTTAEHMTYYHVAGTGFYAGLMVLGALGLVWSIALLGSRTKTFVLMAGFPIAVILVIVNIVILTLGIYDTGTEIVNGLLAA